MVWQDRYYAEPKDILSIRLTCKRCDGDANVPIGAKDYLPEACPYCHEGWFTRGSSDLEHLAGLVQALKALRQRGKDALCKIHFVLPRDINMPDENSK